MPMIVLGLFFSDCSYETFKLSRILANNPDNVTHGGVFIPANNPGNVTHGGVFIPANNPDNVTHGGVGLFHKILSL